MFKREYWAWLQELVFYPVGPNFPPITFKHACPQSFPFLQLTIYQVLRELFRLNKQSGKLHLGGYLWQVCIWIKSELLQWTSHSMRIRKSQPPYCPSPTLYILNAGYHLVKVAQLDLRKRGNVLGEETWGVVQAGKWAGILINIHWIFLHCALHCCLLSSEPAMARWVLKRIQASQERQEMEDGVQGERSLTLTLPRSSSGE